MWNFPYFCFLFSDFLPGIESQNAPTKTNDPLLLLQLGHFCSSSRMFISFVIGFYSVIAEIPNEAASLKIGAL